MFVSLINFERLEEEEEVSWDQLYKGQGSIILANLTTSLASPQTNSQCIVAPVSAIFSLVTPRVIRTYGLVLNDMKRLVLTAKIFQPKIFSR